MAITKENLRPLFDKALEASKNAYAPYSRFPVGAALLMKDGTIITGVNVENRSYGLSNCAERSAVFQAISRGYTTFAALAIAAPKASYAVPPCGACRQVLSEFAPGDVPVIFGADFEHASLSTIEALYPYDSLRELAYK